MFDIGKTRVIGLPCGEEIMIKYLAVSIEYRRVTDRQTDGQNCCDKSGSRISHCRRRFNSGVSVAPLPVGGVSKRQVFGRGVGGGRGAGTCDVGSLRRCIA